MRWMTGLLLAFATLGQAQIPESGDFRYSVRDNRDREVGTYGFTIEKNGPLWKISSDMKIDTRVFFFSVRLHDQNSFTHDGQHFQSFTLKFFKDVPLQSVVDLSVEGHREGKTWRLSGTKGVRVIDENFDEIRNLVSRLIRPEAVLKPGESRQTRSFDPLTQEVGTVDSRGLREESIEFQGKMRQLYVMEQKAADGDVLVKKFANGLIYRSQTSDGYALLQSARTPDF